MAVVREVIFDGGLVTSRTAGHGRLCARGELKHQVKAEQRAARVGKMSSGGRLSINDGRGGDRLRQQLGDGQLSQGAHVCTGGG